MDNLNERTIENLGRPGRSVQGLGATTNAVTEEIEVLAHGSESCRQLMTVPGIGPLIARAMVAAIGNGAAFAKGRDFAAWLGLVPKQMSTGDRTILGRISKRGNSLSTHPVNAGRSRYFAQAGKLGKARFWPVANGRGKPPASQRVGYCPC